MGGKPTHPWSPRNPNTWGRDHKAKLDHTRSQKRPYPASGLGFPSGSPTAVPPAGQTSHEGPRESGQRHRGSAPFRPKNQRGAVWCGYAHTAAGDGAAAVWHCRSGRAGRAAVRGVRSGMAGGDATAGDAPRAAEARSGRKRGGIRWGLIAGAVALVVVIAVLARIGSTPDKAAASGTPAAASDEPALEEGPGVPTPVGRTRAAYLEGWGRP